MSQHPGKSLASIKLQARRPRTTPGSRNHLLHYSLYYLLRHKTHGRSESDSRRCPMASCPPALHASPLQLGCPSPCRSLTVGPSAASSAMRCSP